MVCFSFKIWATTTEMATRKALLSKLCPRYTTSPYKRTGDISGSPVDQFFVPQFFGQQFVARPVFPQFYPKKLSPVLKTPKNWSPVPLYGGVYNYKELPKKPFLLDKNLDLFLLDGKKQTYYFLQVQVVFHFPF